MAGQQKARRGAPEKTIRENGPSSKDGAVKTTARDTGSDKKRKVDSQAAAAPGKKNPARQAATRQAPPPPRAVQARPHARPVAKAHAVPPDVMAKKRKDKFSPREIEEFRKVLLAMHARLTNQIGKMRENALTRDDEVNPEEDGSDAFDRLFTLERAGNEQDTLHQITNALRAIKEGTYGVCEACGCLIEYARLHALPFVKNCVACQSEMERQRAGRASAPRRMIP